MDASLDTNVIIHLYEAGMEDILFRRFDKIRVYDFIRVQELDRHAPPDVLNWFDRDVESGRIELITDQDLKRIGMYGIFQTHVKEQRILFDGGDLGEVYAISLAKTLGCISLVTDDIKERGPHYTLMRIPYSEVMPFAFYELLFLDYLESVISEKELYHHYMRICKVAKWDMDCLPRWRLFIKRFWSHPYSEKERKWMQDFCKENTVNYKERLQAFSEFLQRNASSNE